LNLNAPPSYVEAIWQQILGAISTAIDGCFKKGQDVRLLNSERLSTKSSGGVETFFTTDDSGNLLTPTAGAEYVKTSSAASLTISAPGFYVFTGATSTWTLPAVTGHTGWRIEIKNRGSGDLTVQRAGTDSIYYASTATTITVPANASTWFRNDGTCWCAQLIRAVFG
jgi:hypothetical protein